MNNEIEIAYQNEDVHELYDLESKRIEYILANYKDRAEKLLRTDEELMDIRIAMNKLLTK